LLRLLLVMLLACRPTASRGVFTRGVLPGWVPPPLGLSSPQGMLKARPWGVARWGLPRLVCPARAAAASATPLPAAHPSCSRLALIAALPFRPPVCCARAHRSLPRLLLSSCALNSR
jgi:hypothetical protein